MSFKPFGEVEECKLITDKNTGRAKGYAFVLFKTRAAAKKALKVPQKKIGNRVVSCQLASAGPTTPTQASEPSSWKVFVGNVGPNVNAEKLKEFFRKFGEIEEGPIGLDPVTNKFRGFAVITYKSAEGYKKALEEPFKVFENCHLHCKKFGENHNNKNSMAGQNSLTSVNPAVPDVNYGSLGATPAILGANLNPGGLLMAQNPGIGLAGSAMLASSILRLSSFWQVHVTQATVLPDLNETNECTNHRVDLIDSRLIVSDRYQKATLVESKILFKLAAPAITVYFLNNMTSMSTQIFGGHLGNLELAAFSLANNEIQ
ncbi:RNA-binding protein musashi/mRNA cleavage and polyadenylation factor I complex [Forsythia ovata]|uniref:RNA-binding protein musashi/mRNA cleavage and polyadenylation factor I complex n=1 Tax=Forsythia ovata TaxID=205694 RepID=A0ABD1SN12_9LAMI